MNLIERYIFRRVLSLSISSLFVVTFMVLTTQVLRYVNVLTQPGQALSAFAKIALTLTMPMVLVVLPFALILGSSNTLNRMSNDSELAVLEAAGAGRKILVKPVMAIAVGATIISLIIALVAEPWSDRIRRDLLVAASADLVRIAVQSGAFLKIEKNLYIQVADQYPGGALGGIFLADRRDENTHLIYYARAGSLTNRDGRNLLIMSDGEIHRRSVKTGEVSIISFASYAIDMSQYGPASQTASYGPKEWPTYELLNPDPNHEITKNSPEAIRGELHTRFSEWLYPLAFALISVFFAGTARANRQERLWSLLAVFTSAFALRGAGFIASNGAGSSAILAIACYALPLGAIAIVSALLLLDRSLVVPQSLIDQTNNLLSWLNARRTTLQARLARSRFAGNAGGYD